MALTLGQFVSGAGYVSEGMRQAEEAERQARQNQLAVEAQNRADELRRRTAQVQAGLQVANVPQFAGMTGGQPFARSLGVPVPPAPPAPKAPAPTTAPARDVVPEVTVGAPDSTTLTQRPPSGVIGPATYPGYETPPDTSTIAGRYQVASSFDPSTPLGRAGIQLEESLAQRQERDALRTRLNYKYGPAAGLGGVFMKQTDEERQFAKEVMDRLGELNTEELRQLEATGKLPPKKAPKAGVKTPTAEPTAQPTTPQALQPRSVRNNNPGNIMYGDFAKGMGATGKDENGFAVFPDNQTGQQAMANLLQSYGDRGFNTVSSIINRWSPPTGKGNTQESTNNYIAYVAGKLGVDPNQQLDLNNQQLMGVLMQSMGEFESGNTSPLKGKTPAQTADIVASAVAAPAPAATGVMYGPSSVSGGIQDPNVQSALMLRQVLAEQYRIAAEIGMPDAANNALAQVTAIDLGLYKAQADLGIQEMTVTGDASRAMSVYSQFTGTPTQVLRRSDGTYDLYSNGQLAQTSVPVNDLAELIKTAVDAAYRQQKAELAKEVAIIGLEQGLKLKQEELKQIGAIQTAMINGQYDILTERAKLDGKLTVDTANGVAYLREGGKTYVVTPNAVTEVEGIEQRGPQAQAINLP